MRRMLCVLAVIGLMPAIATAETLNGFDLGNLNVSRDYVARGGPPRDGIPALTDPAFVSAEAARIADGDRVMGVAYQGEAKAYPLSIMNWHEVVNDRFADTPVVVTYCPLCFTGMAFEAERDGERQIFGVSGLLYNSAVLLYDRETESLWSQVAGEAVSGPLVGESLTDVPAANTTWGAWRERHPDSVVLSRDTGHARNYDRDPYASYEQSAQVIFDVAFRSEGYHPKERVLGLSLGNTARAYPVSELQRADTPIEEDMAGRRITIHYDADSVSAEARNEDGELLPGVMAYWFAWYTFHPDTSIFRADAQQSD